MKRELLLGLAFCFALSTTAVPKALAQEDGAELLEERCSVCHPSARPKSKQKTPEQWEATVSRMMGKGAKLTKEEKVALVDHLSKSYKP
jgi:cytochrome c5